MNNQELMSFLKELITTDIEKTLNIIKYFSKNIANDSKLENLVVMQMSNYNNINEDITNGILDTKEAIQQKAKLRHGVLYCIDQIGKLNEYNYMPLNKPLRNSAPEIFLSYAWGGESEKIVNELDAAFQVKGITLVRDKRDLGFKGTITDFMVKIGEGNAVVTVISDKYLKSPYCMFELLEIYRNLNFKERIFPIVLSDANVFDPLPRLQYLKHWQDKKKELDDAIIQFGTDAITVIGDDYKIYKKIFDNFGEVVNILKDINSLTPDMHRENNFKTLIDAVTGTLEHSEGVAQSDTLAKKPRIDTSLEGIHDNRKKAILKRLERLYKMLDKFESQLMLSNNPKEQMMCEEEIEKLNEQINEIELKIEN